MAPSVPTIKYEISAFELPLSLDMYLEKSGILLLARSRLKGLSKLDEAACSAGDELTARTAVVVVGRRAAAADRARARVTVERGAIGRRGDRLIQSEEGEVVVVGGRRRRWAGGGSVD